MKTAELTRYSYMDGRRQIYAIWLRLLDGKTEQFHGPVIEYRAHGWERHATNLIIDSIKFALTLVGYEIIGEA